ncbi:SagB/ThcOx family dehydrogenase, partial [Mesorhizobium sp. M2C.T.Ca.TU.002.02.1.1]|uniref:SagB/ThcOx family dehydrogenase n=1 Tax=Mesorhizobium sp. M2C.T.Ca.TU.002.02.1.1 TaxID=2496788 RepID=UPI000FD29D43
ILYCSMGITGFYDIPGIGKLPIKMAPSGGARNPYEAYVAVLKVQGLAKGIYHYSAYDHSLGRLASLRTEQIVKLAAEQQWTINAAAMIILVASVERTMWKYGHPNALKVIFIEAGHIAQNMLLLATELGLSTCPTAALDGQVADKILGLNSPFLYPVHAIVLGSKEHEPQ